MASLKAFSAYDLPSVEVLIHYLHTATGLPVHSTWIVVRKAGNYSSWDGLAHQNASKYCPSSNKTLHGHTKKTHQGLRSPKRQCTKTNMAPAPPNPPNDPSLLSNPLSNELHVYVYHISKLYTYNTGSFPVRSLRGNQYIMIAYHCDYNTILQSPFKTKKDTHQVSAYSSIIKRLKARDHSVELKILDNEASAEYMHVNLGVVARQVPTCPSGFPSTQRC